MSIGKIQRYGLPYANVVPTGIATNQITPGRTLECLRLVLGGTFTKAMMSQVRVKANGKVIIDVSGVDLDKINAYRGEPTHAAFLDIQFADYKMIAELDRQVGAFDTSIGIANITTEISIAGATAPTLKPILIESAQQKAVDGGVAPFAHLMTKILSYPFNIANGGQLSMNLPFGPGNGAIMKRVHIKHGGNLQGVTIKQDGLVIHESIRAENEYDQVKAGRVPQANMYTLDFVLDGNIKKALDTRDSRSLEWLFTFSAADTGTVYVEYLDLLSNN